MPKFSRNAELELTLTPPRKPFKMFELFNGAPNYSQNKIKENAKVKTQN